MVDLSDFKRGQIIAARMTDASVTKTAELFGALFNVIWVKCSSMVRETWIQSQIASYQNFKNGTWYLLA